MIWAFFARLLRYGHLLRGYSDDSLGYSDTGDVSLMDDYLVAMDATINTYVVGWVLTTRRPFRALLMADANAGCASYTSPRRPRTTMIWPSDWV